MSIIPDLMGMNTRQKLEIDELQAENARLREMIRVRDEALIARDEEMYLDTVNEAVEEINRLKEMIRVKDETLREVLEMIRALANRGVIHAEATMRQIKQALALTEEK
jgi:PAS domain-containing protein